MWWTDDDDDDDDVLRCRASSSTISSVTGGGVCDMKIWWGVCGTAAVGDVGMSKGLFILVFYIIFQNLHI